MKINYIITDTLDVDESAFKDAASENDKNWDEMSDQEKIDFVKEVESENGFEEEFENRGSVEITSVELDS